MPSLLWDEGTAYDLFVSLNVLHRPVTFGVRPSWAAGVRSRLPASQREYIEKIQSFLPVPLSWLYLLPAEAKNAAGALNTLAQLPAAERLTSLLITPTTPIEATVALHQLALCQTWSSAEQEVLRTVLLRRGIFPRPNTMKNLCEAWIDLSAAGEQLLQALNTYYQVFFKEEEERIRPFLQASMKEAQNLATKLPLTQLLEELSHGVRFEQAKSTSRVILVPSYWSSPLVFYDHLSGEASALNQPPASHTPLMMLFGIRSDSHDLTPGETLPQDLVDAMKAIAVPTRLRILRYLSGSPLTPSELSKRLRLRPPTVIHHLNELRLAGLVEIRVPADGERAYQLRRDALMDTLSLLTEFLTPERIS